MPKTIRLIGAVLVIGLVLCIANYKEVFAFICLHSTFLSIAGGIVGLLGFLYFQLLRNIHIN